MGLSGRARAFLLFLSLAALLASPVGIAAARQHEGPPDLGALLRKVRQTALRDYELQSRFTYVEERRDIRVSRLGKVEIGPLRTFQVFPSPEPGRTYKRLIAIDGRPLPPEELERRDREHGQHLAELEARRRHESAKEREERLRRQREEHEERAAILNDAFAVFQPAFAARERIDGQPVYRLTLSPRERVRVHTREGRWMRKMAGQIWISEAGQIVRIELEARDDLTIGWGLIGRVHEGSRLVYSRRLFDGVWLPAEIAFDASGRTLLFRSFDIDVVTTYSNYSRKP